MKRILVILLSLLVASNSFAATTCTNELTGRSMKPELAEYICDSLVPGGSVLPNVVYLKARNAANSADLSLLKADASDNTVLNTGTGKKARFAVNDSAQLDFSSGLLSPVADGTFVLGATSTPYAALYFGNSTNTGVVTQSSGNANVVVGAYTNVPLSFRTNNADKWQITTAGAFQNDSTNGGDVNMSKSGTTLAIQEATAGSACSGTLTANGATPVVVSTTCATTGSRVFLSRTSAETGTVSAWKSALSNGVSFSVTSEAADTGTYDWFIVHESP